MHSSLVSFVVVASFFWQKTSAANQQIIVGGQKGLVFTPSNVTAAVGDTITFIFESGNHTVTQSAFASPCTPLVNATSGAQGFDSAFVPVSANATENPAWTLKLEVSTPIWIYCRQATHCQQGMVASINAPLTGNNTFTEYLALAKASTPNPTANDGSSTISSGVGAEATGTISQVASPTATKTKGSASAIKSMSYALLFTAGVACVLL